MRMRTRLITILILSCAVAASAALAKAPAPSTSTTAPGKNGAFAFKRYLDRSRTTGAIFTMDASGKNVRQITQPETGTVDDQPDWSPDGSLLVFYRCAPGSPCGVYTVKPDGSALTPLLPCSASSECEDGEGGSFLPDGKRVVFTRASGTVRHLVGGDQIEHSDIVVRDVSGGASAQALVRSPRFAGDYLSPHFSPDGSQFVYIRSNSTLVKPARTHALFVARADGSNQRRVTPWPLDGGDDPDWSPDGKLLLFRTYEAGAEQSQIATIRSDGSHLRTLTHFKPGTTVLSHSFSPDGKWIVFAKSGLGGEPDLFVMRANGSGIRPITRTALWDSAPDWGPVS
jgi:Tol biopolymer transport system component